MIQYNLKTNGVGVRLRLHRAILYTLYPIGTLYILYTTEVELLWRRTNAPSVALRGGLRLLRLAEFVRYNRAAIGGPSKRQPMNSLVSSCLGSAQTPKIIKLMNKIGEWAVETALVTRTKCLLSLQPFQYFLKCIAENLL